MIESLALLSHTIGGKASTSLAVREGLSVGLPASGELPRITAVPLVDGLGIRLEAIVPNVSVRQEYAGVLHGMLRGTQELTQQAHALGLRVSTPLGRLDISLAGDSLLGRLGLNEPVADALQPAIQRFVRLRLDQLQAGGARPGPWIDRIGSLPWSGVPGFRLLAPLTPDGLAQWAQWEQQALRFADGHGLLLTAKRIDYLVGSDYIEGAAADLPLVGNLGGMLGRWQLGQEITPEEIAGLTGDVLMVATVALLPAAGPLALGPLALRCAANGALLEATHAGVTQGITAYLRTRDLGRSAEAAGAAALRGAACGAVEGIAAGKMAQAFGATWRGALAAGGVTGGTTAGAEATMRVIRDGASLDDALRQIAGGTVRGALEQGLTHGTSHGIERLAGTPIREVARPPLLAEATESTRRQVFDRFLSTNPSLEARLQAHLQFAQEGAYLRDHKSGPFLGGRLAHYARDLRHVEGMEENLRIIGGNHWQATKGQFAEIGRAHALQRSGQEIVAIGKKVLVPGLGRTDIDILTTAGRWIENKHVVHIAFDDKSRLKIDKMAEAVARSLQVDVQGRLVTVREAVFVNSGTVDARLVDYAAAKGVAVHQKTPYSRPV